MSSDQRHKITSDFRSLVGLLDKTPSALPKASKMLEEYPWLAEDKGYEQFLVATACASAVGIEASKGPGYRVGDWMDNVLLSRWGLQIGVVRRPGETDKELKARIYRFCYGRERDREAVPLDSEGSHHMVGIVFPGTPNRTYHYRTTVDFDIGEEIEFRRGQTTQMVRVADVCPARVEEHFRYKWLTFNREDCLYEVEV